MSQEKKDQKSFYKSGFEVSLILSSFADVMFSVSFVDVMDAVVSWILENWPVLGVIVVVAVIVWLISQYVAKLEASRRKMDSLPCESHKASIDKLAVMNTTVDAINDQVTEISKWIMRSDGSMIDPLTRKCSPRVMTSLGKQLFELSGAAKVLDENSELEKSA